ncbi:putative lipid II flippase FtsW [Xanthomonadaceae bacterium XH05]|nr:putative lipid II flippase FtsW [Xanthomonadaceae bacterium XH05]
MPDRVRQAFRLGEIEGRYDPYILGATLALVTIGVVMVASSSLGVAERLQVGPFHFLVRHVMFLTGGLFLALVLSRVELRTMERQGQWLLPVSLVLLVVVLIPGIGWEVNGARRWLNLGVSKFQVVEAVKVFLIVWLASYLVRHREQVQSTWWGLIKPMVVAGTTVMLLLAQPDFGSALLVCAIVGGMVFLGGVRIMNLVAPALIVLPAMALLAMSEPYRVRRLTSFLDPWAKPFDEGFQLTQALIAIGRGEWFGVGLGSSIQKLSFLPEAHTDFIFAVIAEETGFFGALIVISLFALLVGRAFWLGLAAMEAKRPFAGYCAFGVALWIGLQAFVSIGVNLGLLPTKGLTLPLISSGGSSVLMTCVAVGLLLRIGYEVDRTQRQLARIREGAAEVVPPEEGAIPMPSPTPVPTSEPVAGARPRPLLPVAEPIAARGRIEPTLGVLG